MDIGKYTFEEFKALAAAFHSYPAPGLLLGGYMVEMARRHIPEGTLFEAMVESPKCLPDAVQLLTLCSAGNQWMKIIPLGRYALSLYDKYTGEGCRVYVDEKKLRDWPEYYAWFMQLRPKAEQDSDLLFKEIETAGDTVCSMQTIRIDPKYLVHAHMGKAIVCPVCKESYPSYDGGICRACQGESPYVSIQSDSASSENAPFDTNILERAPLRQIPVEQALGKATLHDMTEIIPDVSKGVALSAGHILEGGDVCRLQRMGKFTVYDTDALPKEEWIHENDAVKAFAERIAGEGVRYDPCPTEGKITFTANQTGLLHIDLEVLERFNLVPDVMLATRRHMSVIESGRDIAGSRSIPLYIPQANFSRALTALGSSPLLSVHPFRPLKTAIIVTGTEIFQNIIEDKFIPILSAKLLALGCPAPSSCIVPDDRKAIAETVRTFLDEGVELIITTAGLSVDPDDVTRLGLIDAGLATGIDGALYGVPVLPGTMSLIGKVHHNEHSAHIIGVPACALYHKVTAFDLILPRILADQHITRRDLARMAEGGFCHNCKICTWPKCQFTS